MIDHLRRYQPARQFLKQIEQDENLVAYISVITEAELASGKGAATENEKSRIQKLLNLFGKVTVDSEIAWSAGDFRCRYGCRYK